MSKMRRDYLPNGRKVIWVGAEELQIAVAKGGGHIAALRRPLLFDIPTFLLLPAGQSLWVRYIMGVLLGIADPADVSVSGLNATLVNTRGEIGRVELPETCASARQEGMDG